MNGWRWNDLNDREKRAAMLAAEGKKDAYIASELGVSETRVTQILTIVYRIIGVGNRIELALGIGKHWEEIKP
jgi:DNA-binding CsgD family transcriptional regulator